MRRCAFRFATVTVYSMLSVEASNWASSVGVKGRRTPSSVPTSIRTHSSKNGATGRSWPRSLNWMEFGR